MEQELKFRNYEKGESEMDCKHNYHLIRLNGFQIQVCRKCGEEKNFEAIEEVSL